MSPIQAEPRRLVRLAFMTMFAVAACIPAEMAAGQAAAKAAIAHLDPCSLLKKEEIQHQVELSLGSKLAGLQKKGIAWSIAMQSVPRGDSRACEITWDGKVNHEVYSHGDFAVVVTYAGWLTGSVEKPNPHLPIPDFKDYEAYFVGGKSGPPYARVGDIAVGIENFPDTKLSKSGVDLLRIAAPRAHPK